MAYSVSWWPPSRPRVKNTKRRPRHTIERYTAGHKIAAVDTTDSYRPSKTLISSRLLCCYFKLPAPQIPPQYSPPPRQRTIGKLWELIEIASSKECFDFRKYVRLATKNYHNARRLHDFRDHFAASFTRRRYFPSLSLFYVALPSLRIMRHICLLLLKNIYCSRFCDVDFGFVLTFTIDAAK